ncbi:hypothetical protein [Haliscomenobacter hydrossis]|uniref:DUF2281 domain-containing protein n=1 Tax=Haliscomenobacter hydrossis (strain ATCC 27775 / DSM 1100 / LMG 10767 / O) TaxID=760192 RepID=F4KZQ7_HALH1|nr:hypothetical protein [Haliscomenobacter hydrossis]AEE50493.1 hypothetical protein Halhy_2624 [Haliscomenobacter hydrossis DSM 1100]
MGESILNKFELLDIDRQKQLLDFLDFLLFQQKSKHVQEFNYDAYRNQILSIGTWSDDDVAVIEGTKNSISNPLYTTKNKTPAA